MVLHMTYLVKWSTNGEGDKNVQKTNNVVNRCHQKVILKMASYTNFNIVIKAKIVVQRNNLYAYNHM